MTHTNERTDTNKTARSYAVDDYMNRIYTETCIGALDFVIDHPPLGITPP